MEIEVNNNSQWFGSKIFHFVILPSSLGNQAERGEEEWSQTDSEMPHSSQREAINISLKNIASCPTTSAKSLW